MDSALRLRFVLLGGLFLALIAVGLLLVSFYRETARATTVVIPADVLACDEDDDCGLANQIGCCSCEVGGGQGAVNKQMRVQLKGFLNRACRKGVSCVTVSTCRTDLRPACERKRCTLATPSRQAAGEFRRRNAKKRGT